MGQKARLSEPGDNSLARYCGFVVAHERRLESHSTFLFLLIENDMIASKYVLLIWLENCL